MLSSNQNILNPQTSNYANLCRAKSFLDKLLWDRETHPEDIYRVKGMLDIAGEPRKYMVQVSELAPQG